MSRVVLNGPLEAPMIIALDRELILFAHLITMEEYVFRGQVRSAGETSKFLRFAS